MPSGKMHLTIEALLLGAWIGLSAYLLQVGWMMRDQAVGFLGAYALSMLFMSPDLDLSRSDASRRWGILRWAWIPYAWAFRHRQTSHHPVAGPLSRMLYVGTLGLVAVAISQSIIERPEPHLELPIRMIVPVLLGLYLPNLEHILADRISTWRKRKRSARRL